MSGTDGSYKPLPAVAVGPSANGANAFVWTTFACPACMDNMVKVSATTGTFVCRRCGDTWTRTNPDSPTSARP